MALALAGLGAMTLVSAHDVVGTSRLPASHLVLDRSPVAWLGGVYLALAGLPLALWCRTPRAAAGCASACMLALAGCLLMAVRAHG